MTPDMLETLIIVVGYVSVIVSFFWAITRD